MKKPGIFILVFFVFSFIVSCNPPIPPDIIDEKNVLQTVEVTRIVPQTVIVTRAVQETVAVTQIVYIILTATPTVEARPTITLQALSQLDPSANPDAAIVQYYTYLDQGDFEKAHDLLSPTSPNYQPFDEYLVGANNAFKKVEIYDVQPYNGWAVKNGYLPVEETETEKFFFVSLAAWGEGNMSGSVVNGRLQSIFMKVVREEDGWKISTFDTAPPMP